MLSKKLQALMTKEGGISLSYVGASFQEAFSTSAIDYPSGTEEGDIIVISLHTNSTTSAPIGWTQAATDNNGSIYAYLWYKVADSTDETLGSVTIALTRHDLAVTAYRPDSSITTLAHQDGNAYAGSGNAPAQVVNASSSTTSCTLVYGSVFENGTTDAEFSTASPAFDAEVTGGVDGRAGYKIYNPDSTPVDHTIDMDDLGGTNGLLSCYFEVS